MMKVKLISINCTHQGKTENAAAYPGLWVTGAEQSVTVEYHH